MLLRDGRATVEGADESSTVKPPELSLDCLSPMESTGHEYESPLIEADEAQVECLMVQGTEAKAVFYSVWTVVRVPMNMSGLQADRAAIEARVEAAHCALIPIGTEHELAERAVTTASRSLLSWRVEVESRSSQDVFMQARWKVCVEHLMAQCTHEIGIGAQGDVDTRREAARTGAQFSQKGAVVPLTRLQVLRAWDLPQVVSLQVPKRILWIVRTATRAEVGQQLS